MTKLYLTNAEIVELGINLEKLQKIRRKLVLDEVRVFVTVTTLRDVEEVAKNHGMSFIAISRYSRIGKNEAMKLQPGTVLGPKHTHGNFMVSS